MFEVTCECGIAIPVHAGQAGGTIVCQCGKVVSVPPFSRLRRVAEEAGRSMKSPPSRHDWKMWWWGIILEVSGELIQLICLSIYLERNLHPTNSTLLIYLIIFSFILITIGTIMMGLGKGFAMWFCLLLLFCIPYGRLVILFIPGKGMDKTP